MWKPVVIRKPISLLLDLLFPSVCPVCENRTDDFGAAPLCSTCRGSIKRHPGNGCGKCAAVTAYDATPVCQECRAIRPVFDRIIAYGIYEGVLQEMIRLMKFGRIKRFAALLGAELSSLDIPPSDCIIPVPLSLRGLRKREFNQSALIAATVSKRIGVPLNPAGLTKTRETRPQSDLSRAERKENVKGAFKAEGELRGKRILLVDDVVTTGATVNECARALKKKGASTVNVLAAARASNQ